MTPTAESTAYLSYAGFIAGVAGAAFLAKALLFERAQNYASGQAACATIAALEGIRPEADLDSACDTVDTRLGIVLFLLGTLGAVLATAGVAVEPVVAFEPLLLALFAALALRATSVRARERTLFQAQLLHRDSARSRYDVYCAYESTLTRRGRSMVEFEPVIEKVEAALGHHPGQSFGPNS